MWVGGQSHAPTVLIPEKKLLYIVEEDRSGRVCKISLPAGFDPRTVQPVASRYTNYVILALHSYETQIIQISVINKYFTIMVTTSWL